MRPLLDGDFASIQAVNEKAIAMADAESLDRVASSVLGSAHPALVVARLLGFSHWAQVTITQLALGVYALMDSDKSMLARIYRYKALGIVMISLARATDGRCSPSNALFYWMEQVPHADHQNPRP